MVQLSHSESHRPRQKPPGNILWQRYGSDTKGLQQGYGVRMRARNWVKIGILAGLILATAGCGRLGNIFGGRDTVTVRSPEEQERLDAQLPEELTEDRETIWDLFRNVDDPNTTLEVNRYIWNAAGRTGHPFWPRPDRNGACGGRCDSDTCAPASHCRRRALIHGLTP